MTTHHRPFISINQGRRAHCFYGTSLFLQDEPWWWWVNLTQAINQHITHDLDAVQIYVFNDPSIALLVWDEINDGWFDYYQNKIPLDQVRPENRAAVLLMMSAGSR